LGSYTSAMLSIRAATGDDAPLLSDLAIRSKGFWGYDDAFVEACRDELRVDAERLEREIVRVAVSDGQIAGFASVDFNGERCELMTLFVEPEHIGTGVGSALLRDAAVVALSHGCRRLRIESDPFAEDWYKRRGAEVIGGAPSLSIPGRTLPLLDLPLGERSL